MHRDVLTKIHLLRLRVFHHSSYDVMKKCWRQEAVERPTFVEIRLMINLLIGGISKKKNVLTNEPDYI